MGDVVETVVAVALVLGVLFVAANSMGKGLIKIFTAKRVDADNDPRREGGDDNAEDDGSIANDTTVRRNRPVVPDPPVN